MTLKIDYFGCADGAAYDARGMLTLVGFNPSIQVQEFLPKPLSLALVLSMIDDEPAALPVGGSLSATFQIKDPSGTVLAAIQQTAQISEKAYPELPAIILLAVQVQALLVTHGKYEAYVSVQVDGRNVLEDSRPLWVVAPPERELR